MGMRDREWFELTPMIVMFVKALGLAIVFNQKRVTRALIACGRFDPFYIGIFPRILAWLHKSLNNRLLCSAAKSLTLHSNCMFLVLLGNHEAGVD